MSHSSAALKEPWRDLGRQRESTVFGIWVFLASEMLFFGALLLTYAVYRIENPQAFAAAARETDIWYGTVNTAILMTSSLTMAMASQGAEWNWQRLVVWCLAATVAFGLAFGVLKGFEYAEDIRKGLVPGPDFVLRDPATQLFFALYWTMTGLHAIHLTIGIALVSRLCLLGALGRIVLRGNPQVEVTALYWHLIDVIWIILYPLIYLPGRAT